MTEPSPEIPPELEAVIARVVKRARLRKGEREDVRRELRSHFAEALEEGKSIEEVVGEFGDVKAAGRMIGRAKRRCRGIVWHAWVWSCRGVMGLFALVVVMYGWAAAQYYRPSHVSSAPYEERLFAAMGLTEDHKGDAWKAYREFKQTVPDEWEQRRFSLSRSAGTWSDDEWAEAADLVAQVRPLIDHAWPSLDVDRLGYTLRDWREDPERDAEDRATPLLIGPWPFLSEFNFFLQWARFDWWFAERTGDIARIERLVPMFMRACEQCTPVAIDIMQIHKCALAGTAARWVLAETTAHGVARIHDVGEIDAALAQMHDLSGEFPVGGELVSIEDFLAHMYGGDEADRRINAAGWGATLGAPVMAGGGSTSRPWWWPGDLMSTPLAPVLREAMPTLGESLVQVREYFARTERYIQTPVWRATGGQSYEPNISEHRPWEAYGRYPYAANLPYFANGRAYRARAQLLIDAARTALAMCCYQRDHSEWPESLDALVPAYMSRMPIDQFTGESLRYRITVEGPVLYSVGMDRDDDGGIPIVDQKGMIREAALIDPGEWARRDPEYQARDDGDWILWPACECPDEPVWMCRDRPR